MIRALGGIDTLISLCCVQACRVWSLSNGCMKPNIKPGGAINLEIHPTYKNFIFFVEQNQEPNMLSFIKSSLKYFIVGILAVIPLVIIIQVLVFLETILRHFIIYIYGYSNNIYVTVLAFILSFIAIAYIGYRVTKSEKLWVIR